MRIKSVQYSHMGIFSHMRAVFGRIMHIYIFNRSRKCRLYTVKKSHISAYTKSHSKMAEIGVNVTFSATIGVNRCVFWAF